MVKFNDCVDLDAARFTAPRWAVGGDGEYMAVSILVGERMGDIFEAGAIASVKHFNAIAAMVPIPHLASSLEFANIYVARQTIASCQRE